MFIAEIGINHNGDPELAKRLIRVAKDCGADVVKFQKRNPDLCVPEEQKGLVRNTVFGRMTYLDYKYRLEFGQKEYDEIDCYCRDLGILWTASVWDADSLDFIDHYDVPFIKIPSACLTDLDLLRRLARTGRKALISTGMSTEGEIETAVRILAREDLGILHCNSSYPSREEELDLCYLLTLKKRYPRYRIGYSGHEEGWLPTLAAGILGAEIIERHITLDKTMPGSDQRSSLEPEELRRLIAALRRIPAILGKGKKTVYPTEEAAKQKLRRRDRVANYGEDDKTGRENPGRHGQP